MTAAPAQAMHAASDHPQSRCFHPRSVGAGARRGDVVRGRDTRDVSVREQRAIQRRTHRILARKGYSAKSASAALATGSVDIPVYFHVMLDKAGNGDVTQTQINAQIAEMNQDYAGQESSAATATAYTFHFAGVNRYHNSTLHRDGSSTTYRSRTTCYNQYTSGQSSRMDQMWTAYRANG